MRSPSLFFIQIAAASFSSTSPAPDNHPTSAPPTPSARALLAATANPQPCAPSYVRGPCRSPLQPSGRQPSAYLLAPPAQHSNTTANTLRHLLLSSLQQVPSAQLPSASPLSAVAQPTSWQPRGSANPTVYLCPLKQRLLLSKHAALVLPKSATRNSPLFSLISLLRAVFPRQHSPASLRPPHRLSPSTPAVRSSSHRCVILLLQSGSCVQISW